VRVACQRPSGAFIVFSPSRLGVECKASLRDVEPISATAGTEGRSRRGSARRDATTPAGWRSSDGGWQTSSTFAEPPLQSGVEEDSADLDATPSRRALEGREMQRDRFESMVRSPLLPRSSNSRSYPSD
jgi:hypothetical protein